MSHKQYPRGVVIAVSFSDHRGLQPELSALSIVLLFVTPDVVGKNFPEAYEL